MRLFNVMQTAFENFDSTIMTYLNKTLTDIGQQFSNSQIFVVIFNGIKGVIQNVMVYIEDAFTEQNIETAKRKKSIYSLAKISGYEPYYGAAATGTLIGKMIINNSTSLLTAKIYIPNHTLVKNINSGVTYMIMLPTDTYMFDISKPLITHEFKIVQGNYNISKYVAKGIALETVNINMVGLWDRNYIKVYVDGEEYTEAGNLYDMTKNSKNYLVSAGYDNELNISFGNGIFGKQLEYGQQVNIEYVSHSGSSGNVYNSGESSWMFYSGGVDGLGNTVDLNEYITLFMNYSITGGLNSDSIGFVRNMIGTTSRTGVLTSEDNFRLYLSRFSFIGQSNCWVEKNSLTLTLSCLSNKYNLLANASDYFNIETDDLLLSKYEKEMILTALNNSNKAYAGLSVKFYDPIIRKYAAMCYVKVNTAYNKENVKLSISNAIANYFMNLDTNTQFIPKSDIIKAVLDSDDNILSFDIDFISELAEQCYYDGYYIKYESKNVNGETIYVENKKYYESSVNPGLDEYGNIYLSSKLEIPLLRGNFAYYMNKENNDKTNKISNIEPIQYVFI